MNVIVYGGSLAATLPVRERIVARSKDEFIEVMCTVEDAFGFLYVASAMPAIVIIRAIRDRGSHAPLVVLMEKPHHTEIAQCLNAGADQVEHAAMTFKEVDAYLEAIPRRGLVVVPDEVKFGDFTFRKASGDLFHKGRYVHLGDVKRLVLRMIVTSKVPPSSLDIAMGIRPDGSMEQKTVDVHINQLRRKLRDLCPSVEYIVTSYKFGYRFEPQGVRNMRKKNGRMIFENRLLAGTQ